MSSPEVSRRSGLRLATAALVALAASACLRPLYGPTASGAPLRDVLAAIDVEPVATGVNQERIGHYLRSELVFELDGSGEPSPKRFRLKTVVTETVSAPFVDIVTSRAVSAILLANATYTLSTLDGKVVTTGVATASASYNRTVQRFATVRAARDAEIRAAKELAQQIRTRLAAALVAPG